MSSQSSEPHLSDIQPGDGAASVRLREAEADGVVSRRGVLWKAGLATVAGVGVLSAIDQQRSDAATGGNFVLGNANNANQTTSLVPTSGVSTSPLFLVNGASMGATQTTMEVNGPSGGAALAVTGASTATTIGLAVIGSGSGTAIGVIGTSSSGVGVRATSSSGRALEVIGKAHFSRSGSGSVASGHSQLTVTVAGMTSSSLVLATLQKKISGLYVIAAVPTTGQFTVYLSKITSTAAKFAWFVLD
jgi:hypothetical protein